MVIWAIARTTVGEAMRKKVLNVCLIVALAMIVLSLSFTQLGFRTDMTIVKALGLFVILLAGFIISLLMSIQLIPNEIERRTIYTILAKPVARYQFVLGKFLGGIITLFINTALMGGVFIAMIAIKSKLTVIQLSGGVGDAAGSVALRPQLFDSSLLLGVILIFLQFVVLSALVMLFSTFLTPTVNFFAGASVYVLGSASSVWMSMAKNPKAPVVVKWFYSAMGTIVPHFDQFNVQNRLIHPEDVGNLPLFAAGMVLYALLYTALVMTIAVLVFYRKEV